jgi:hypothetical protein
MNKGIVLTQKELDEVQAELDKCMTTQDAIIMLHLRGWSVRQMTAPEYGPVLKTKNLTPTPPQHVNAVLQKFRQGSLSGQPGPNLPPIPRMAMAQLRKAAQPAEQEELDPPEGVDPNPEHEVTYPPEGKGEHTGEGEHEGEHEGEGEHQHPGQEEGEQLSRH